MRIRLLALAGLILTTSAAAETFNSGDIAPGDSWSFTFQEENEGGYWYHCHPHPWMKAMVHVNPDSDMATTTHYVEILEPLDADEWGYSVEHLVVQVGDTVVWNNTGGLVHTVSEGNPDGGDGHDHDHGDHMDGEVEDTPAPPVLFALAAICVTLWMRKR